MKVFINGFGRIGRTVLRQALASANSDTIEIVGINDPAGVENAAYLFKYDSVFGVFSGPVQAEGDRILISGQAVPFSALTDISVLDLSDVDVVMECTGLAKTPAFAKRGLVAGARAVLISGPSEAAEQTIVLGANEGDLGNAAVVSNSSCTTNAIAPFLAEIDRVCGVTHAHITTIHCYTGSQPTLDAPSPSFERGRSAATSIVPTSTSAASEVRAVLPKFADGLSIAAVRVPNFSVSAIDAVLQIDQWPAEGFDRCLETLFVNNRYIGVTNDPCVSSDMRGREESLVVALRETQEIDNRQVRIFGWYDNEWGYAARMIDAARLMASR